MGTLWLWGTEGCGGEWGSTVAGLSWALLWVQAEQRGPQRRYPQPAAEGGVR